MGETIRERISSSCECVFCGANIKIALFLGRGDLVYCVECGEAYILSSLFPPRLQPQAERQIGTPWLDGSRFI